MNKTKNQLLRCFIIFISMMLLVLAKPVPVRAANINISYSYLHKMYMSVSYVKSLKARIGGMTVKSSRKFPTYYASGNKMILGVNNNPKESRQEKYLYVQNTGNKKVLLMGVKLGMTSSATKAKLTANGFKRRSATLYTRGEAGILKLSMKKSKITGWKYYVEPTS